MDIAFDLGAYYSFFLSGCVTGTVHKSKVEDSLMLSSKEITWFSQERQHSIPLEIGVSGRNVPHYFQLN